MCEDKPEIDDYKLMWSELVKRLTLASQFSLSQDVTYTDVITVMAAYEREFLKKDEK